MGEPAQDPIAVAINAINRERFPKDEGGAGVVPSGPVMVTVISPDVEEAS